MSTTYHRDDALARAIADSSRNAHRRRARRTQWAKVLFLTLFGVACWCAGRATAAELQAPALHAVLHGLSWHSAAGRTETRTEPVTEVVRVHGKRTEVVTGTRTVEVPADWQQRNWGAGLRAAWSPTWGVQAGVYRNSYDRTSVYLVGEATPLQAHVLGVRASAGAFAGAVTGYPALNGRVGVAGGLLGRLEGERLSATVRYVPKVSEKQSGHTASIELGWRL
jgi:hypothetical protein